MTTYRAIVLVCATNKKGQANTCSVTIVGVPRKTLQAGSAKTRLDQLTSSSLYCTSTQKAQAAATLEKAIMKESPSVMIS